MAARLTVAVIGLANGAAFADPPQLMVDRVQEIVRYRHKPDERVVDWIPSLGGVEIPRDRFYLLVDRPDLARAIHVRQGLGTLAIVGGVATIAASAYVIATNRYVVAGTGGLVGGLFASAIGLANVLHADDDGVSPREAERLLQRSPHAVTLVPLADPHGGGIAIAGPL